jgi:DNA damage-inducible protein 1
VRIHAQHTATDPPLKNKQKTQTHKQKALEHSPEVFGTVHMLYVVMEVNPKANPVPVKAFVDSGAQMTIMTAEFAEKCGLAHLIDSRFQGTALGVGSTPIIGRIHAAPMRVAGHHVSTSITVLAQKTGPQFILGLDNLKRHQCCIDLARGVLRFGSVGADLEFLPEHEIPRDFRAELDEVGGGVAGLWLVVVVGGGGCLVVFALMFLGIGCW